MDKTQRKALKRGIGAYTWALLIYYLIFNVLVLAVQLLNVVYAGLQAVALSGDWMDLQNGMLQSLERVVYSNGWGYLISCGIAVAGIRLWKGRDFFRGMFQPKTDMTVRNFWHLQCVMMAGQLLFQITAVVLELILNAFGLSLLEAVAASTANVDSFSMFLYMGIGAPIVEEIIFRGMVLRGLAPYGKRFAIIASAVLFGLFHANPIQSIYAFVVGLVLGYTAMEHSIWWAMVLHMINNMILGDTIVRLMPNAGPGIQWGLILVCSVWSVVILIRRRREIGVYRYANPVERECKTAFFTSVPNLLFFLIMAAGAVSMLIG